MAWDLVLNLINKLFESELRNEAHPSVLARAEVESIREFLGGIANHPGILAKYKHWWDTEGVVTQRQLAPFTKAQMEVILSEIARWRARIAAYEVGRQNPPVLIALLLLDSLGEVKITPSQTGTTGRIPARSVYKIPLVVTVPSTSIDLASALEPSSTERFIFYQGPETPPTPSFAATVKSRAWHPRFSRGEIILFRRSADPIPGAIGLVQTPDGEVTLRTFVIADGILLAVDLITDRAAAWSSEWIHAGWAWHRELTDEDGLEA